MVCRYCQSVMRDGISYVSGSYKRFSECPSCHWRVERKFRKGEKNPQMPEGGDGDGRKRSSENNGVLLRKQHEQTKKNRVPPNL